MIKEIWKDIPKYEGIYQASNMGRIKSLKRKTKNHSCDKDKILKPIITGYGYYRVGLVKNKKLKLLHIHKLVLAAFYGKKNKQGNHLNGIKTDNRLCNLEYCTQSENQLHAWRTGLQKKGNQRKIICNETGEIFKSLKTAADKLNTTNQNICHMLKKRRKTAKGFTFRYMEK